jgi:TolB-like protein
MKMKLHLSTNHHPERVQLCPRKSTLRNSRTWLSALLLLALTLGTFAYAETNAAPPASASTKALTVAVYDFNDADKNTGGHGNKVTTLVAANLTAEPNLIMLERADLTKVLNEQAFDISGMVSADAAAKIGQITGVKVLVAGQIIKTREDRLIIIANIIGTETSRLFAVKVEGAVDNLLQLTSDLSRQVAQTISAQATNLVSPAAESHAERVARIVKCINGKNRPAVSISMTAYNGLGSSWRDTITEGEFGVILSKAGFTVVDDSSDTKPDLLLTGTAGVSTGLQRGGLLAGRAIVELKIQERQTGKIICFDRQEATATDIGMPAAQAAACIKAADDLAERNFPLLAK